MALIDQASFEKIIENGERRTDELMDTRGCLSSSCEPKCPVELIIIISIFKEDNVFRIIASLPYGPPMNTDIDYYRT